LFSAIINTLIQRERSSYKKRPGASSGRNHASFVQRRTFTGRIFSAIMPAGFKKILTVKRSRVRITQKFFRMNVQKNYPEFFLFGIHVSDPGIRVGNTGSFRGSNHERKT